MTLEQVTSTIIGKITWLPRMSFGTFVTFEFGTPLLVTREPITKPDVHPRLAQRRVTVQGEQHLWIQADHWRLKTRDWTASSNDERLSVWQKLETLAGSRLISLEATPNGSILKFEYGEALMLQPSPDALQTQWSIYWHTGGSASWLSGGTLRLDC